MLQATIIRFAATAMALGIALGAFGAHALKARVPASDLAIWATGVQYHLITAVALLALGALWPLFDGALSTWGIRFIMVGVSIFSVSLYLLVLTGPRWMGAITPIGGVLMITGWLLIAVSTIKTIRGM